MSVRLLVFAVCAAVFLAGCKLVIKVPEGGEVRSQSGTKNCAAGKTCTFDIVDLFFDDTFTAKAAPGYQFKRWKKRDRGLCGGDKTPCHLYTAPLANNPNTMAVLESNQKFYLEPVFEPSGTDEGPVSKQNLSACFNKDIFVNGSKFTLKYSSVDKVEGNETIAKVKQNVVGNQTFKGQSASLATAEITVEQQQTAVSHSDNYFVADVGAKRSTNLGGTGETIVDGVGTGSQELEFVPGLETRYDLAAGESHSQTYTINTVTSNGFQEFSDSQTQTLTVTYIGVVSIEIKAGKYQACKLEEITSGSNQGIPFESFRTYWLGVGIGVQLKEDSESSETELVSGSINGKSI